MTQRQMKFWGGENTKLRKYTTYICTLLFRLDPANLNLVIFNLHCYPQPQYHRLHQMVLIPYRSTSCLDDQLNSSGHTVDCRLIIRRIKIFPFFVKCIKKLGFSKISYYYFKSFQNKTADFLAYFITLIWLLLLNKT